MKERIDKLEQLDLSHLKAEDLSWQHATGQDMIIGSGRTKQHSYRNGVQTPIGDIEIAVWIKAAEYIVERDQLQEELERLRPYRIDFGSGSAFAKQVTHGMHLNMCLDAIYRNPTWASFIPYNQLYHPELLAATPMAKVMMDCCQTVCTIPAARTRSEMKAGCCPNCGQWASFKILEIEKSE